MNEGFRPPRPIAPGLPPPRPVSPELLRTDTRGLPTITLVLAVMVLVASIYTIFVSMFAAMVSDSCYTPEDCDAVGRWWFALIASAFAMPCGAVLAMAGARAARSPRGRVLWTLAMFVAPIAWVVVLLQVPQF